MKPEDVKKEQELNEEELDKVSGGQAGPTTHAFDMQFVEDED